MNKKVVITIVILVALAILAAFYFKKYKNPNNSTLKVEKQTLDAGQIPSGFPKGLIIEAGSSVIDNYEAKTPDGRLQSTRIMSTAQPIKEAVAQYSNYFVSLGWTKISDSSSEDGSVSTILRKDDDLLLVTAKTDSKTSQSSIELSLTEAKK